MNLAQQQQALLADLFSTSKNDTNNEKTGKTDTNKVASDACIDLTFGLNARGFLAYRANGLEMAHRALAGAYPVLGQLLGEESFTALAAALWQAHPPERGDLAQWGHALADFVDQSPQLADDPYLPDVARAEWALHRLKTAPDETTDLPSLQLLITSDPAVVKLCITSTQHCLESRWPLASIWLAHQVGPGAQPLDFEQVGRQIRQQVAQTVLIWRDGLRPRLREAMAGEADFLAALQQGESLGQAVQMTPALDFSQWLPLAAQTGLLTGAKAIAA
jgi:hypothetical protein